MCTKLYFTTPIEDICSSLHSIDSLLYQKHLIVIHVVVNKHTHRHTHTYTRTSTTTRMCTGKHTHAQARTHAHMHTPADNTASLAVDGLVVSPAPSFDD